MTSTSPARARCVNSGVVSTMSPMKLVCTTSVRMRVTLRRFGNLLGGDDDDRASDRVLCSAKWRHRDAATNGFAAAVRAGQVEVHRHLGAGQAGLDRLLQLVHGEPDVERQEVGAHRLI